MLDDDADDSSGDDEDGYIISDANESSKMETFKAEPVIADNIIGTFLSALDCGGGSGLWAWEA